MTRKNFWLICCMAVIILVVNIRLAFGADLSAGNYQPHTPVIISANSIQDAGVINLVDTDDMCWYAHIKGDQPIPVEVTFGDSMVSFSPEYPVAVIDSITGMQKVDPVDSSLVWEWLPCDTFTEPVWITEARLEWIDNSAVLIYCIYGNDIVKQVPIDKVRLWAERKELRK